jgi:hypothetical protein
LDTVGDCCDPGYERCYSNVDETEENEERTGKRFLEHYRSHSVQLVDALKWGEHPNAFSSCSYIDGRLEKKPAIKHSKIPYLQYMMKHLEKSYPELFESINEIANEHEQTCREIDDVMIYCPSLPVVEPSFHKIITDRIASVCPNLNATVKKDLTENNIYISDLVFGIAIFNTVESKESVVLLEEPINENKTILWYHERAFALGQGDHRTIKNLRKALEELVWNSNIKKRVEQYALLDKKLDDERINELLEHIDYIYESIHGGQILAGYPICDLCHLPDISP